MTLVNDKHSVSPAREERRQEQGNYILKGGPHLTPTMRLETLSRYKVNKRRLSSTDVPGDTEQHCLHPQGARTWAVNVFSHLERHGKQLSLGFLLALRGKHREMEVKRAKVAVDFKVYLSS